MRNQRYKIESASFSTVFEFVSEGTKGNIRKLVKYTETSKLGFYNLGFGDKIGETNDFDDTVISDNGDTDKVLATVAATLYEFTNQNPEAFVFATGSTIVRTRLYRISLSNALSEIRNDFSLLGYFEGKWEVFERNRNYSAFLITRK